MRDMLLNAAKSYYVGMINKHISNVEILLTRSVGIGGTSRWIQQAIDAELRCSSYYDDKLNMIIKIFLKRRTDRWILKKR